MTDRELATLAIIYSFTAVSLLMCHIPSIKRAGMGIGLIAVAIMNVGFLAIGYIFAKAIG